MGIKLMLFVLFVGLMSGNFAYQAMFEQHWIVATERSFFQAVALGMAALSDSLLKTVKQRLTQYNYHF